MPQLCICTHQNTIRRHCPAQLKRRRPAVWVHHSKVDFGRLCYHPEGCKFNWSKVILSFCLEIIFEVLQILVSRLSVTPSSFAFSPFVFKGPNITSYFFYFCNTMLVFIPLIWAPWKHEWDQEAAISTLAGQEEWVFKTYLIFKAWKHPDGLTPWLISYPTYKVEKHKCTIGGKIWLFTECDVFFSMPFVTVLLLLALETSQFLKMSLNLLYSKFFLFFPHLFFPAKLMHKMFPLGSNYTVVKKHIVFQSHCFLQYFAADIWIIFNIISDECSHFKKPIVWKLFPM